MNRIWNALVNIIKKVVGKLFTRTTATFLLFLFLAFALWVFQKQTSGEFNANIPVAYINKPGDIRIDSELPQSVSVAMKMEQGGTFSLFKRRAHDTIYVDLQTFRFNTSGVVKYPSDSIMTAAAELYQGFTVLRCTPSVIDIRYSRLRQKTLKVIFADTDSIQVGPACMLSGPIAVEPNEITVYGSYVDTMMVVRLKHLKKKVYDSPTTEYIPVINRVKGLTYSDTVVKVHIPVERALERVVTLPIEVENQPSDTILHIFPSEVELTYLISANQTEPVDESQFKVCIDFRQIDASKKSCQVMVHAMPPAVSGVTLSKKEVSVLMEKVNR